MSFIWQVQTDPENAADANNRSALSAIAIEMASMDEDDSLEDAEVKFELFVPTLNWILFDWSDCAVDITGI